MIGSDPMILLFWILNFKQAFSLSSFTFIKKLFSSSLPSAQRVVPFVCMRLLMFLLAIFIPAWASSSPTFHMMYSAYKLNKQSLWTPFSNLSKSIVSCLVLTVASLPAYRFLRKQARWSGIPISLRIFQFVVIHTVKVKSTVICIANKAEVNVFLELSCFFSDATDVGNLISDSSAFSNEK